MNYSRKKIQESIKYWKEALSFMAEHKVDEASADDILANWRNKNTTDVDVAKAEQNAEQKPLKVTSYTMGNSTHTLYAGDLVIGLYLHKDASHADYSVWRMSRFNVHKFKSFKSKLQTSSLKTFLNANAEKIEGDQHGSMSLEEFVKEMKRVVGDQHFERIPALFVAGSTAKRYHYDANAKHRGKTLTTTNTTGKWFYDLDNVFDADDDFEGFSGQTKAELMSKANEDENDADENALMNEMAPFIEVAGDDHVKVADWIAKYYGAEVRHGKNESWIQAKDGSRIEREFVNAFDYLYGDVPEEEQPPLDDDAFIETCINLERQAGFEIDPNNITF